MSLTLTNTINYEKLPLIWSICTPAGGIVTSTFALKRSDRLQTEFANEQARLQSSSYYLH